MSALKVWSFRALLYGLALFPLGVVRALGRALAYPLWWVGGRTRKVTETNIRHVLPQLSSAEQRQLAFNSIQATMELFAEMGAVWTWPPAKTLSHIRAVHGLQHLEDALAQRRGTIVLAPHLGNWEVLGLYLPALADTVCLYEPPQQAGLETLMIAARERAGARVVPTDARGIATLLRSLKRGGITGILPDQVPEKDKGGINVPFMGHDCYTGTLTCNLLQRTGARAVYGFAQRVAGGFELTFLPAAQDLYSDDMEVALRSLNQGVEECLHHCIEQYQWEYKRFKTRPRTGPRIYEK